MAGVPALQAFLEKQFGGRYEVKTSKVTVGTSVDLAIDHNYERLGLTFINLSANNIFLSPDRTVSSTEGIELIGSGSNLALIAQFDLALVGHEWYALASAAGSTLYVIQVVRYIGPAAAGG